MIPSEFLYNAEVGSFKMTGMLTFVKSYPMNLEIIFQIAIGSSFFLKGSSNLAPFLTKILDPKNES